MTLNTREVSYLKISFNLRGLEMLAIYVVKQQYISAAVNKLKETILKTRQNK